MEDERTGGSPYRLVGLHARVEVHGYIERRVLPGDYSVRQ